MSALRKAFIDELKDLLDAERQLLKALPKMAKAAQNDQLRTAFEEHQEQTAQQIKRLGRVFEAFEEPPAGKKCKGMEGLIEEAEDLIEEKEGDAALIAAAQKAEHYEISAYGSLAAWAMALGQETAVQALTESLNEEKEADKKLSVIAQSVVNSQDSLRDEEKETESKPAPSRRQTSRRTKRPTSPSPRSKRQASKSPRSKRQASKSPRSRRQTAAAR